MSCDPLQEKHPNKTTYHFCSNNPINRTDPTGMLDTDFLNQKTGEHTYVNDGRNQVLQVSDEDYKILQENGFNHRSQEYKDILGRSTERKDLFYTISNVLNGRKFESFMANGRNCFTAARKQNNADVLGPTQRIDVLTKANGVYQANNYTDGVDYIKNELTEQRSVMVGVYDQTEAGNHNHLTGHFVNIVGMGFDERGNYFSYYDNADSKASIGTNLEKNKLYESKTQGQGLPIFYDDTDLGVRGAEQYVLTEVRRNKNKR